MYFRMGFGHCDFPSVGNSRKLGQGRDGCRITHFNWILNSPDKQSKEQKIMHINYHYNLFIFGGCGVAFQNANSLLNEK